MVRHTNHVMKLEQHHYLLQYGATHEPEENDATPLFIASKKGYKNVCEYLIQYGATHKRRDDYTTPFNIAYTYGHKDVCELLLKHNDIVYEHRILKSIMLYFLKVMG